MLYYHTDAERQFIREHTDDLAQEMRRMRRLTGEPGSPKWRRLAAWLTARAERLRPHRRYHAPAYDA